MYSLDSDKWETLEHAYGSAEDIPKILHALLDQEEGAYYWDNMWSSLCHQGTIYSATFAVFPYLISALKTQLEQGKANVNFYYFATCVEISRQIFSVEIPEELNKDYFLCLKKLNQYQKPFLELSESCEHLTITLAFQAAIKNQPQLAEFLLNLQEEEIEDVSQWYFNRESKEE